MRSKTLAMIALAGAGLSLAAFGMYQTYQQHKLNDACVQCYMHMDTLEAARLLHDEEKNLTFENCYYLCKVIQNFAELEARAITRDQQLLVIMCKTQQVSVSISTIHYLPLELEIIEHAPRVPAHLLRSNSLLANGTSKSRIEMARLQLCKAMQQDEIGHQLKFFKLALVHAKNSDCLQFYSQFAQFFINQGRYQQALEILSRKMNSLYQIHTTYLSQLVHCYYHVGDFENAEEIAKIIPEEKIVVSILSRIFAQTDRIQQVQGMLNMCSNMTGVERLYHYAVAKLVAKQLLSTQEIQDMQPACTNDTNCMNLLAFHKLLQVESQYFDALHKYIASNVPMNISAILEDLHVPYGTTDNLFASMVAWMVFLNLIGTNKQHVMHNEYQNIMNQILLLSEEDQVVLHRGKICFEHVHQLVTNPAVESKLF